MFDLRTERAALYEAITTADHHVYVSQDQVGGLIGLVKQGLKDKSRENRVAVMAYLIGDAVKDTLGVEFRSYKNMSSSVATMLINQLRVPESVPWRLSAYGQRLLSAAEGAIKAYAEA